MANSNGTLSGSLIIQEALALSRKIIPIHKMVTTDFTPEGAKKDQAVISRILGKPTVNNFGSAASDTATTDVSVTLNLFKEVRYKFTAAEVTATDRNLIREVATPMAVAIAEYLAGLIGTLYTTNGTFTNETVEAAADVDFPTLLAVRSALNADARGTPMAPRFGLVNSAFYAKLMEDSRCNRLYKDSGGDPLASGFFESLAGFQYIQEFPGLPTTDNASAVFGHKAAGCLVVRPPVNPAEVFNIPFSGNIGTVTDPETGFTVLAFESINNSDLSVETVLAFLAGTAAGDVRFLQRVVTA